MTRCVSTISRKSVSDEPDLPDLREHIRTRRTALAGFLELGANLALEGDLLQVIPRKDNYVGYLNDNRASIGELASEFYGRKLRVEVSPDSAWAATAATTAAAGRGGNAAESAASPRVSPSTNGTGASADATTVADGRDDDDADEHADAEPTKSNGAEQP